MRRRLFLPGAAVLLASGLALLVAAARPAGNSPAAAGAPAPPAAAGPAGTSEAAVAEEAPAATLGLDDWRFSEAATRGREVYARWCIGCHGPEGRGDGAAAALLDPLPRDFQSAAFKFRSTPSGELPLLEDVMHVVRCGLKGSAMPSFPLLPQEELRDVSAWVLGLAEFGMVRREVEYVMDDDELSLQQVLDGPMDEIVEETLVDAYEEVWPVPMPQRPEDDEASRARGAELYAQQCTACHGASGRGDGPSSFHLRDGRDAPLRPRDFTTGLFRAGSRPEDVWLRLRTGLNGTPMPAIAGSDEDLWHMVHYILSLRDPANTVAPHPTACEHDAANRRPGDEVGGPAGAGVGAAAGEGGAR